MTTMRFLCVLLVGASVGGCGGHQPDTGVIIEGVLLDGGSPIKLDNPEIGVGIVTITLIPVEVPGYSEETSAMADAEGKFRFEGQGLGVPAGKYKIAVMKDHPQTGEDVYKGKFSAEQTTLQIDVPADKVGDTHDAGTLDLQSNG